MVWLRNSSGKTTVDATLRLEYDKKFSAGASWRIEQGYVVFAGINIKGIEVGYAYGRHTKTNHELYLRYQFPLEAFKPKRQPHKSIRLL